MTYAPLRAVAATAVVAALGLSLVACGADLRKGAVAVSAVGAEDASATSLDSATSRMTIPAGGSVSVLGAMRTQTVTGTDAVGVVVRAQAGPVSFTPGLSVVVDARAHDRSLRSAWVELDGYAYVGDAVAEGGSAVCVYWFDAPDTDTVHVSVRETYGSATCDVDVPIGEVRDADAWAGRDALAVVEGGGSGVDVG